MNTEVRLHGSCDRCLQSKVKCSQRKPSCYRCARNGNPCVYSPYQKIGRPSHKRQARSMSLTDSADVGSPSCTYTTSTTRTAASRPVVPRQNPSGKHMDALGEDASPPPPPRSPIGPRRDEPADAIAPDSYDFGLAADMLWADDDIAAGSLTTPQSHDVGTRGRACADDVGRDEFAFHSASGTFTSVGLPAFDKHLGTTGRASGGGGGGGTPFPLTPSSLPTALDTLSPGNEQGLPVHRDGACSACSIHAPDGRQTAGTTPGIYTPGSSSPGAGTSRLGKEKESELLDVNIMSLLQVGSLSSPPDPDFDLSKSPGHGRAHEPMGPSCVRQCCLQLTMRVHRLAEQGSEAASGTPSTVAQHGKRLQAERDMVLECGVCMQKPQREQTLMLLAIVIDRFLPLLNREYMQDAESRILRHRLLVQQFRAAHKLEFAAKAQRGGAAMSVCYSTEILESVIARIETQLEAGLRA